jgi:hypothetical protein
MSMSSVERFSILTLGLESGAGLPPADLPAQPAMTSDRQIVEA